MSPAGTKMRPEPRVVPTTNKTIKQFARLLLVPIFLTFWKISIQTITLANERPNKYYIMYVPIFAETHG
jgi:hypothetical protein